MLFPGREGQDVTRLSLGVHGLTDDAAGHLPEELLVAGGEETKARSPERGVEAEALGFSNGDIGPPGGRGLEITQREGFGGDGDQQALGFADLLLDPTVLFDDAEEVGGLHHHGSDTLVVKFLEAQGANHAELIGVDELHDQTEVPYIGADGRQILGVDGTGDEETGLLGHSPGHEDSLGGRGGTVVEGGVGVLHPGQGGDHGLVLEDRLEGSLGDLGLVRGIGGDELGLGAEGVDRFRNVVVVASPPEEEGVAGTEVLPLSLLKVAGDLGFRKGGSEFQGLTAPVAVGNRPVKELLNGGDPDGLQHLPYIFGVLWKVAH